MTKIKLIPPKSCSRRSLEVPVPGGVSHVKSVFLRSRGLASETDEITAEQLPLQTKSPRLYAGLGP